MKRKMNCKWFILNVNNVQGHSRIILKSSLYCRIHEKTAQNITSANIDDLLDDTHGSCTDIYTVLFFTLIT